MSARVKMLAGDDPHAMLDAVLSERPGLAADLARAVLASESSVSRWRRRKAIPGRPAAVVIERRCGIPARLWDVLRATPRAERKAA